MPHIWCTGINRQPMPSSCTPANNTTNLAPVNKPLLRHSTEKYLEQTALRTCISLRQRLFPTFSVVPPHTAVLPTSNVNVRQGRVAVVAGERFSKETMDGSHSIQTSYHSKIKVFNSVKILPKQLYTLQHREITCCIKTFLTLPFTLNSVHHKPLNST